MEISRISKADAILYASALAILPFIVGGAGRSLYNYSPVLFWIFDFFQSFFLPLGLLIWLGLAYGIAPLRYGMRAIAENESWMHFLGLIVFLAFLLYLVYYVAFVASWLVLRPPEVAPFYASIAPDGWFRFPVVLYLAATAGIFEEIFFRALPLAYLNERFPNNVPVSAYVVGTSLLFGAAHSSNGMHEVAATFIFGVFASVFYLKLRDLWPLIGAHTLVDIWGFW